MLRSRLSEIFAARQIARQIVEAARAPGARANSSNAQPPDGVFAGAPETSTQVDENGNTLFDALFDADAFDDTGPVWA